MIPNNFLVLGVFMAMVSTTTGNPVGYIEEPQFSYLEKDDVEVEYQDNFEKGVKRSLYVCCIKSKEVPKILADYMCRWHSECPKYKEMTNCESDQNVRSCYMSHVLPNITLHGYVSQRDSRNVTLTSRVATYVTTQSIIDAQRMSQHIQAPRPVANVNITAVGSDLHINWIPSAIFFQEAKYKQLLFCFPVVEGKNAKIHEEQHGMMMMSPQAFRQMLDFPLSSAVVYSSSISALTQYQCCLQVENVLTSVLSERRCKNITSPDQAPKWAPVILCGNATDCPSVVMGDLRNVTVSFELPDVVKNWNGDMTHHVFTYRKESGSNITEHIVGNGSATQVVLTLSKSDNYLLSMKSCKNKFGCSPQSNTVRLAAVQDEVIIVLDKFPTTIVIIGSVVTAACLSLLVVGIKLFLQRSKKNAKRGKLPKLENTAYLEYYHPAEIETPTYHVIDPEQSVHSLENSVSIGDEK